ncbi:MAG: hypothetical protein U5K79_09250 [Cyclobacteriaceae bacterium]|nr:hypothetical protein [Cyclobacteriaceae bacterium]
MDFKILSALITEAASSRNTDVEVIIADLAEIVKLKYGVAILEKERELIDEVKNKVITKLYNAENHVASVKGDTGKTFKLDILENDFLKAALQELQSEGLISLSGNDPQLTKEGVLKFKKFYGEI